MATFEPTYLLDLRDATLDLGEPCIRVIDAKTKEWVASVLPDDGGFYDTRAGKVLAEIINQRS